MAGSAAHLRLSFEPWRDTWRSRSAGRGTVHRALTYHLPDCAALAGRIFAVGTGGAWEMEQDRRLSEIRRIAQDALIEAGAVSHCERHDGMLIHGDSAGAESVAFNLASVWLERAIGSFLRDELEEAVRAVLASAGEDGCPECAKARASSMPERALPSAHGG